jgi:pimeloyl-ACP methyl ester carboxylesterase
MRRTRFLVLYSHGNAEDVGQLPELMEHYAAKLGADILAYEYPGYSLSTDAHGGPGSPSEAGCYRAASAAYAWAVSAGGGCVEPSQIIPFGRSLGSGAACYTASVAVVPVGGLILQSPLLSGASAIFGSFIATLGMCIDPFKNYAMIARCRCRVAICHGTVDDVVPCWNGQSLHKRCADSHEPLWCEERGHNDMDDDSVLAYGASFLDHLDSCRGPDTL